jgi:hypothetical protein
VLFAASSHLRRLARCVQDSAQVRGYFSSGEPVRTLARAHGDAASPNERKVAKDCAAHGWRETARESLACGTQAEPTPPRRAVQPPRGRASGQNESCEGRGGRGGVNGRHLRLSPTRAGGTIPAASPFFSHLSPSSLPWSSLSCLLMDDLRPSSIRVVWAFVTGRNCFFFIYGNSPHGRRTSPAQVRGERTNLGRKGDLGGGRGFICARAVNEMDVEEEGRTGSASHAYR